MPCPDCGVTTAPGARFCHFCGRRLEGLSESLRIGDRRVVTAVFADLVGYTKLVDELDPEEVRARVDGALGLIGDAVSRFGGSIEKFIGDAILAVFGIPAAHDDDALRACLCALEMQACLSRYVTADAQPLVLRIGIATGEVVAALREVAGTRSIALTGEPITTAARIQQLAEPNEILVDLPTKTAAEPRIGVEFVGEKLLRGQSKPVKVHRLFNQRRFVSQACRRTAPLVGRAEEQARLREVLHRTAETRKGAAVLLRGEAGVGKSRLLCEMEADARDAGFGWMWLDNAPHGLSTPYTSVRKMADWIADEEGVTAGVAGKNMLVGPDVPTFDPNTIRLMLGAVAVLARDSNMNLLPEEGWEANLVTLIAPHEVADGLRLATGVWVNTLAARKPRCIVVDDYHWVDPSSKLLMEHMIRLAADLPIVVLTGSRYPADPPWLSLPHVQAMDLGGLDECATEELGSAIAGANLDDESAQWLYRRTSGNALFVGEIVKTLRDAGHIEEHDGHFRIETGSARRSVPLSLRAVLGARIDALPASQRTLLEAASVVGMEFSEDLLCVLQPDCATASDLESLAETGFILRSDDGSVPGQPVPGQAVPGQDGRWRFRHQLFQDAAYGRLLNDRRHQLHGTLADWLEETRTPVEAGELGRHRAAAGDAARALPLLERALREAVAVGATEEAATLESLIGSLQVQPAGTSAG